MPIEKLPIITRFNRQRFVQFSSEDCANWTQVPVEGAKNNVALYPQMGRRHIITSGQNRLIFGQEPRATFRSEKFAYIVSGGQIFQIARNSFAQTQINPTTQIAFGGLITFAYLVTPAETYCAFCDGSNMFIYRENQGDFGQVTDVPSGILTQYVVMFGNRFAIAAEGSSQFTLARVNNIETGQPFSFNNIFGNAPPFAQERGSIRGFGVLHNTLYIFTEFTTGVWSLSPSTVFDVSFPWRKNTTYDWDYGLYDYQSLDIDFDMMCFLGQNKNGLVQVLVSNGQNPTPISTKAIDVLFETFTKTGQPSPFLNGDAIGFLYQYENTVFYRLSAGNYENLQVLDQFSDAQSIEFNFDSKQWSRCIELNGERNRIKNHVYFSNRHLVTVDNDNTVYEMSGRFYINEIRNPLQPVETAPDAYEAKPIRYELITPIIFMPDYSEFITDYIEIDFVWGIEGSIGSQGAFANTEFLIAEDADVNGNPIYLIDEEFDSNGNPVFLVSENSNTPSPQDTIYNNFFKPHIELFWSDNGGMMYYSADVRQFSDLGYYRWRMRWHSLGVSRNRTYKLVCVSPYPVVILGGNMNIRRASGGAN